VPAAHCSAAPAQRFAAQDQTTRLDVPGLSRVSPSRGGVGGQPLFAGRTGVVAIAPVVEHEHIAAQPREDLEFLDAPGPVARIAGEVQHHRTAESQLLVALLWIRRRLAAGQQVPAAQFQAVVAFQRDRVHSSGRQAGVLRFDPRLAGRQVDQRSLQKSQHDDDC
jgi:hypothetical protein